jgi:hypothetical protein
MMAGKWKRQDEPAYREEKIDSTWAIRGTLFKDSEDPPVSGYWTALPVDMGENDNNDGKEAKPVYLRDKPIAGNDTAK